MDVVNEEWDVLVILDACRYDMFSTVYGEFYPFYLLKKVVSPATYTADWLVKTFPGYYEDIVYISANAYINSGMEVGHRFRSWMVREYNSFDARKHFPVILDVWKQVDGNRIHPIIVNKAFSKALLKYKNKRFILHYMQPHRPYLSVPKESIKSDGRKISKPGFVRDTFSVAMNWIIKKYLLLPPTSYEERMYRRNGWKGLKDVYCNDIRLALKYVKILTDSIEKNFVITSDHGERLGEHWWHMSHGPGPRHKEVVEVPWLEVFKNTYKEKGD